MNKYINEILRLAEKALSNDDVPVGAIVVYNNKIIGRGYNKKNKTKRITDHAEIIAINKASKKIGDWRLDNCELYVTLEPCNMCKEVIKQSRIKKVYYLTSSLFNNEINRNISYEKVDYKSDEYLNKLNTFFKSKR